MKVKLCGFSEEKSLKCAIDNGVDFVGFVFCDISPRNINFSQAEILANIVPSSVGKVAVVVDADINFLQKINLALKPQYFQLHGSQNIAQITEIKNTFPQVKIIKAFAVEKKEDLAKVIDFVDLVDFFLFDGKIAGSGKSWDFSFLQDFKCKKDWFLSGGLNFGNIEQALETSGANMIDISSGIEKERGKKSCKLIAEFMKKIKNVS